MTTPAQIRAARALLGWKQAELAEKAAISPTALVSIERGQSDPKTSTMNAIRGALEAGGVTFIDGEELGVKVRADRLKP